MHFNQMDQRLKKMPGVFHNRGFTLMEVMVAMAVFVLAFSGVFFAYGQSVRMLDGLRQTSRVEDIAMSNIEFLRTRNWTTLTNLITTSSSSTFSQYSSNMTESINAYVVVSGANNSAVCTHLELLSNDPLRIGIKNIKRDIVYIPSTISSTTSVIQARVIISWESLRSGVAGLRLTNSMTTFITKGGMSADVF